MAILLDVRAEILLDEDTQDVGFAATLNENNGMANVGKFHASVIRSMSMRTR